MVLQRFRVARKIKQGLCIIALLLICSPGGLAQPEDALRIDRILPDVADMGDQITILGQGFRNDSVLLWDGYTLDSEYVDRNELKFIVPAGINCGIHTLQVENPLLLIGSVVVPLERSQVREIFVSCGPSSRTEPLVDISRVEPSRTTSGEVVALHGQGFVTAATRVQFDNEILDARVLNPSKLTFQVPEETLCGMHSIRVQSPGAAGSLIRPNKTLWIEVLCGQTTRSPSIFADFSIKDFDENGDCIIQNIEIFDALDAWVNQLLDDEVFFDVVDAWVTTRDICSGLPFSASAISLKFSRQGIIFSAPLSTLASLSMQIYDLQGREIFKSVASERNHLIWNLRDAHNKRVSNGVYLVKITRALLDGSLVSEVRKLHLLHTH